MYFVILCFYKNEINITSSNNKKSLVKHSLDRSSLFCNNF